MAKKIQVILGAFSVLFLTTGLMASRGHSDLFHPPHAKSLTKGTFSSVTTTLGYHAKLMASFPDYLGGIGVADGGEYVFFSAFEDSYALWLHKGEINGIDTPAYELDGCRNRRGGVYFGDDDGNIWWIKERSQAVYLGHDYYHDYVDALDINPDTGATYFITNYFEDDYFTWTGLYKLTIGQDTATLLDWWEYAPSAGIALRGDTIYVTDYWNDSIWTYSKSAGTWKEIVTGLNGPLGIDLDALGNMYVTEGGGTLARVTKNCKKIDRIASGFGYPFALELDNEGRIYVTDEESGMIWKIWK
jgi:hypothetical protein